MNEKNWKTMVYNTDKTNYYNNNISVNLKLLTILPGN